MGHWAQRILEAAAAADTHSSDVDPGRAYAAGVRDDAENVWAGRSFHAKHECPGCGRGVRSMEWDGYCRSCAEQGWN